MKILISLTIVSLFLSSCCKSRFLGELKFSRDELSIHPYTGNEELRFVDDSSNVILFHYGHRVTTQAEYKENQGVDCSDYYLVEDNDKTYFYGNDIQTQINIQITNQTNPFSGPRKSPILNFSYEDKTVDPDLQITFKGLPVDSIEKLTIKTEFFRDSLTLRSRTFHDIFIMPGTRPLPMYENGDTLYFTRAEGIVALKFKDGQMLTKQY